MNVSEQKDELITLAELAQRTKLSAKNLYRLAKAGALPGTRRIGGSWRILWAEFIRGTAVELAAGGRQRP